MKRALDVFLTGVRSIGSLPSQLPYSKLKVKLRKPRYTCLHPSHNGLENPKLAAKFLRHSERVAWELGVVEELRSFDEAAAAFPNPPPVIVATCVCSKRIPPPPPNSLPHWKAQASFAPLFTFFAFSYLVFLPPTARVVW